MGYRVETVSKDSVKELCELQNAYSREVFHYNGAAEEGFFLNFPPLEGGKNVFCVLDSENKMIGYSMVFRPLVSEESPSDVDYEMWCDLTIPPLFQKSQEVKGLLYESILARAREIRSEWPERRIHLIKGIFPVEHYSARLFRSKGLKEKETCRTLFVEIQEPPVEGVVQGEVEVRRFMPHERAEKLRYLNAHNQVFRETPFDLESLDAHFSSEGWSVGTLICAFDSEGEIVAGIKVHLLGGEQGEERTGVTDSIFTLPAWRGRGLAKHLIGDALRFLFEQGITKACLEVSSLNENALGLYTSLGYKVVHEKLILMKAI